MKQSLFFLLFTTIVISSFAQPKNNEPFITIAYETVAFTIPANFICALDKLADSLGKNQAIKILITGHTDNVGLEGFNKNLSEIRAKGVAQYLIDKGINKERIIWKGMGSTQPVFRNDFEYGRERNRRVEVFLKIIKGKPVMVEGIVLDESDKPLAAQVTIENKKTGEEVAQTTTNPKTGTYTIKPILEDSVAYDIIISAPECFFDIQTITTYSLEKDKIAKKKLNFKLPKLEVGRSYRFKNVIFFGNEARIKPESAPSLKELLKMMQRNSKLKLKLDGHVNCAGSIGIKLNDKESYNLSMARAKTVADYLINNGISENRLVKAAYGCQKMLFPDTNDWFEQEQNRRVEIKVLEK